MSNAIGRWRAELVEQVVDHLAGLQAAAGEDRQQAAGEEDLAGGAQLHVAQRPLAIRLFAALAFEVDGDRPPVADEVVEQESRRAVVAGAAVDVGVQHALEGVAVVLGAGGGHGFEQQEHAAREVLVGVLVEPDAAGEIFDVHLGAERALGAGAGAVAAHDLGEIPEVGGNRRAGQFGIEGKLRARHRRDLRGGGTLGRGVEEEPVEVAHFGHLGAPPRAEQHDARLAGQAQFTQILLEPEQPALAAITRGEQRREARGAARREVLERAERCLRAVLHQAAASQNSAPGALRTPERAPLSSGRPLAEREPRYTTAASRIHGTSRQRSSSGVILRSSVALSATWWWRTSSAETCRWRRRPPKRSRMRWPSPSEGSIA